MDSTNEDEGHGAEPAPPKDTRASRAGRLPVVALGASAGGLAALEQFFDAVPDDCGLAFVVITHQSPAHSSMLPDLLARHTKLKVAPVNAPTQVEANHIYVCVPGSALTIAGGVIQPNPIDENTKYAPIDLFLRSLAHDRTSDAVAIILSGTGSDGTLGIKEIKAELGMVMVQSEASAPYRGMPHSAISTGLADFVVNAGDMPAKLIAYLDKVRPAPEPSGGPPEEPSEALQQIFSLIRERTGHDFSQYKISTVRRRIERRMNVQQLDSTSRYIRYLENHPEEIEQLFSELLIGVTSFFRDPEAWSALTEPLKELLATKRDDSVVRAWLAGCSTGEEAYSLAILLRECMDAVGHSLSVQLFATDLDASAIAVARAGVYPATIANDVSAGRLARFFTRQDQTYRVKKEIREMIVFAPQDVIADPPFTKLDLLACRNLLIYLDAKLQQRLLPIFHYSLKPNGVLFLGSSESIGQFSSLFEPIDKRWKLFRRRQVPRGTYVAEFPSNIDLDAKRSGGLGPLPHPLTANLSNLAKKHLLDDLVPPTILMRERGDLVYVHGKTGLFLEPAEGSPHAANVFNMAKDGLALCLSAAIRDAASTDAEVIRRGVPVRQNGGILLVDVRLQQLREPDPLNGLFRVTFQPAEAPMAGSADGALADASEGRVNQLERELSYTKESHQATIEELETANEELKSTNEELQSTNEELQSANEELETSKEEMQSLNEELQTVNAELQGKLEELSSVNNDMKNLLNGTDIATVFLDNELLIKRYTEQAKRVIRLIPGDIGRPIGDLVSSIHYDRLTEDAAEVLHTLVFKETEVRSDTGDVYLMRILPYRTTDNVIDGLVLTFVDITKFRELAKDQRQLLDNLKDSPVSVFAQDRELRFISVSGDLFGLPPASLLGRLEAEVVHPETADRLRALKLDVMASAKPARARLEVPVAGTRRSYHLYLIPLRDGVGEICGVSGVVTDLSATTGDDP